MKPPARPVVIGLLGGIASGKSSVAALLAERGAAVLDADALARATLDDDAVRAALIKRFGPAVAPDGRIDRKLLAQRTFGDPEALSYLEAQVHPRVRAGLAQQLAAHRARGDVAAVVLDVPLLLDARPAGDAGGRPLLADCDLLVFVECDDTERRRRGMERRGWDGEELARREAHQVAAHEKRRRADVILRNDGSLEQLRQRVFAWLDSSGGFAGLPRKAAPPSTECMAHERDDRESIDRSGDARRA